MLDKDELKYWLQEDIDPKWEGIKYHCAIQLLMYDNDACKHCEYADERDDFNCDACCFYGTLKGMK